MGDLGVGGEEHGRVDKLRDGGPIVGRDSEEASMHIDVMPYRVRLVALQVAL